MRKTFLARVAEKLYEKHGDNLSDIHIVFPSQRAQVFFERELSILLDKPLWQPTYDSIDNLVKEFSMLEKAHPIKLLTELYLAYTEVTSSNENLDEFYSWGELLLADFDTIDKYRVNAKKLFSNIESLSELDELFDTDTEEKTLIINFWKSFSKKRSKYSDAFLSNWKNLYNIYDKFRERLRAQGLGYSGMIYREAATLIAKNDCQNLPQYAFVGFNALNRCEQRILSTLVKFQKMEFYWDADKYYLDKTEQEAGAFLRRNITMFGEGELTPAREMTAPNKNLTVVKSPGEVMQCKALYKELEAITEEDIACDDTAIVLTDESLLPIVLGSIPKNIKKINITMGATITQSAPYILLEKLMKMQRSRDPLLGVRSLDMIDILNHWLISFKYTKEAGAITRRIKESGAIYVDPSSIEELNELKIIFDQTLITPEDFTNYYSLVLEQFSQIDETEKSDFATKEHNEQTIAIVSEMHRLLSILEQCQVEISSNIYHKLLRSTLRMVRLPYIGEPLEGLQIMGILESRCLDFKNVILLSMTDDTFPGTKGDNSYIPLSLRRGYKLPTPSDHAAVWAYYFYRLVSSAKNVTMMYSSASSDKSVSEPSRYIYQLQYESGQDIRFKNIDLSVGINKASAEFEVAKTDEIIEALKQMEFSPTMINNFIDCPYRFALKHIRKMEAERPADDDILPLDAGNILHGTLETLYLILKEKTAFMGELRKMITDSELITTTIDDQCQKILAAKYSDPNMRNSIVHLKKLISQQVYNTLNYDNREAVIMAIRNVELKLNGHLDIDGITVGLKGYADRIDILNNGSLRVVDYKSGKSDRNFMDIASLFNTGEPDDKSTKRNKAALQTMLYGLMLSQMTDSVNIAPSVYAMRDINNDDFSPYLHCKSDDKLIESMTPEDVQSLKVNLNDMFKSIFDINTPFMQCIDVANCQYCDFKDLCNRG